jgi:hypothetical protein
MIPIQSKVSLREEFIGTFPIYVEDLLNAFFDVPKSYQRWPYQDDDHQINERPFCYELYHKWSKYRELNANGRYDELILSGEIYKDRVFLRNGLEDALPTEIFEEMCMFMKNAFVPDMVLHKGQNDNDPRHQKVFLEVKSQKNKDGYFYDIMKCLCAIRNLGYQRAVFIALNRKSDTLQSIISEIMHDKRHILEQFSDEIEKLYIFGRPHGSPLEQIHWIQTPKYT